MSGDLISDVREDNSCKRSNWNLREDDPSWRQTTPGTQCRDSEVSGSCLKGILRSPAWPVCGLGRGSDKLLVWLCECGL